MKRLILNSDDYGRTPEISRGIREAHRHGVVTSTTCMMNISTTANDIAVALHETPALEMGVHLVLTMGKPISAPQDVPSIVDAQGDFFKYTPLIEHLHTLRIEEVTREWQAQIEAFINASGRTPTHLDSHHHSSYFSPALFRAMLGLAREYKCAIRYPFTEAVSEELRETSRHAPDLLREFQPRHPDHFVVDFYDAGATYEVMVALLNNLPEGTTEIMCHPGYVDETFARESIYNHQRDRERRILTDPSIKEIIQRREIQLISFADL